MIKKVHFQLWLSVSLLICVLVGFGGFGYWSRKVLVKRLVEQTLGDNLTIGQSALGLLNQPLLIPQHTEGLRLMLQYTCNQVKLPNKGFLCAVDAEGFIIAAPGMDPKKESKPISVEDAAFIDLNGKSYSYQEFFNMSEPFEGFFQKSPDSPTDIVVALAYPKLNIKLLVLQKHELLTARTGQKLRELWPLALLFSLIIAGSAYVFIERKIRSHDRELEGHQRELEASLDREADKNEELLRKQEELEASNIEKDGLMEILAHDMRAPLNKITGLADIIQRTSKLPADQQLYLNMILGIIEDAKSLINDVMEMGTIENGDVVIEKESVSLPDLLGGAVRSFEHTAGKKDIALSLSEVPQINIHTDPSVLNRVLDNLLSNAIKFTPHGKKVMVEANVTGDYIELAVIDEGPGIKEEERHLLFRKFQRLSARPTNKEASTGLGLYIVKMLVEQLNGTIALQEAAGGGCKFLLRLYRQGG